MRKGLPTFVVSLFLCTGMAVGQQAAPRSDAPASRQPSVFIADGHGDAGCAEPDHGADVCGPPGRVWVSAEYLLWWTKGDRLPPLVTVSPPLSAGVIGAPGTVVLFGDEDVDTRAHSGVRFTVGAWLNECQTFGIEASWFSLGTNTTSFGTSGTGAPGTLALGRPFIDIATGTPVPNAELVAFPGLLAGSVSASFESRLQGFELNALCNLCCCCDYRVDFLAGYRSLYLNEGLAITEDIVAAPAVPTFGGDRIQVIDAFDTHNRFYGGQVGIRGEWWRGRLFANATGKLALGVTKESVDIAGATRVTAPSGTVTVVEGGLLALPTNIGHFRRDEFSVVPEIGFNVGYQITDYVRAFVGYTFLYWSDVVRPGDAIPTVINSTRVPTSLVPPTGPAVPVFTFHNTDFWAQGVNFGIEFRF